MVTMKQRRIYGCMWDAIHGSLYDTQQPAHQLNVKLHVLFMRVQEGCNKLSERSPEYL